MQGKIYRKSLSHVPHLRMLYLYLALIPAVARKKIKSTCYYAFKENSFRNTSFLCSGPDNASDNGDK